MRFVRRCVVRPALSVCGQTARTLPRCILPVPAVFSSSTTGVHHHGPQTAVDGADATSAYTGTSASVNDASRRTALYDLHREQTAHWGIFAGWQMPLWYKDSGQIAEHNHCRNACSLFDVSHMLQLRIRGPDTFRFLDTVTCSDWDAAKRVVGTAKLSCLMRQDGGVVDDLMITPESDTAAFTVVNAGNAEKDTAYLTQHARSLGLDVSIEKMLDRALIAIQGPMAVSVLGPLLPPGEDLSTWNFMTARTLPIGGLSCRVTRCGYTGEDGFEISVAQRDAADLARKFLAHPSCKLAGLGARDTLRLEAGLSLYGSDMDDTTSPIEAGLSFLITKAKRQRTDWYGAERVLDELTNGVKRTRVAVSFPGSRRSARHGMTLALASTGENVGILTSGAPSPTLGYPIGSGYVSPQAAAVGTEVKALTGRAEIVGTISSMPLVPTRYYRIKKAK